MPANKRIATVPLDQIGQSILILRGQRVLLDSDLVAAGFSDLKSQFATANTPRSERRGRRTLPNAFTEHGAIQAANVLNRPRAIEMGIYVVR
jgi:hypothetical protein